MLVIRCAIWYHLHNLKNVKITHGGQLLGGMLPATLLKVTLLLGCFSRFLNCTNGTKSRKAPHILKIHRFRILKVSDLEIHRINQIFCWKAKYSTKIYASSLSQQLSYICLTFYHYINCSFINLLYIFCMMNVVKTQR